MKKVSRRRARKTRQTHLPQRAKGIARRREFLKRRRAAKKGWQTRRKRKRIKKKIEQTPRADYLVSFKYGAQNPRLIDFIVTAAESPAHAIKRAQAYVERQDDLEWMTDIGLKQWRPEPVYIGESTGKRARVEPR